MRIEIVLFGYQTGPLIYRNLCFIVYISWFI